MSLQGVDVASFQGPPGAWRAAAGKIDWAAVKLTELQPSGNQYVNPDAKADWDYLAAQGAGRIGYLFAHPATPVGETVSLFASTLSGLGVADTDGICVDLEDADGLPPARVAVWAAEVTAALTAALDRLPVLYTYPAFAQAGNCVDLGHLPLWIADPNHPAGKPVVPRPWKSWAIQQYQTSQGSDPIDRDLASWPDVAAMGAAIGKIPAPPPPPKAGTSMDFLSSTSLHAPVTVLPNRQPHMLAWEPANGVKSMLGPGREGVKATVAGLVLSCVRLHIRTGTDLRISITEIAVDGKPGATVDADYTPGNGWLSFTAPLPMTAKARYAVTVTNYGSLAAVVNAGFWDLIK